MKKRIALVASALLLAGCSAPATTAAPGASAGAADQHSSQYTATPGVASQDQMNSIYQATVAVAKKDFSAAAAAGLYAYASGNLTQDPQKIAGVRDKHSSVWDEVKTALDQPGCVLTPDHKNSAGVIMIPIKCGSEKPKLSVHAQYLGGQLGYLDAIYGDGTEN